MHEIPLEQKVKILAHGPGDYPDRWDGAFESLTKQEVELLSWQFLNALIRQAEQSIPFRQLMAGTTMEGRRTVVGLVLAEIVRQAVIARHGRYITGTQEVLKALGLEGVDLQRPFEDTSQGLDIQRTWLASLAAKVDREAHPTVARGIDLALEDLEIMGKSDLDTWITLVQGKDVSSGLKPAIPVRVYLSKHYPEPFRVAADERKFRGAAVFEHFERLLWGGRALGTPQLEDRWMGERELSGQSGGLAVLALLKAASIYRSIPRSWIFVGAVDVIASRVILESVDLFEQKIAGIADHGGFERVFVFEKQVTPDRIDEVRRRFGLEIVIVPTWSAASDRSTFDTENRAEAGWRSAVEFIGAELEHWHQPTHVTEERARAKERARILRRGAVVCAALACIAAVGLGLARVWEQQAERERALKDMALRSERVAWDRYFDIQLQLARNALDRSDLGQALQVLKDLKSTQRPEWDADRITYLEEQCHQELYNQSDNGPLRAAAFASDGKVFATAGWERSIQIWNAASGQKIGTPLKGHTDRLTGLAFSPTSRNTLASVSADKTVRLWDISRPDSGLLVGRCSGTLRGVNFSPRGDLLAVSQDDGRISIWTVQDRKLKVELSVGPTPSSSGPATSAEDSGWVHSVVFSPDGLELAASSYDKLVHIWDAGTWKKKRTLRGHTVGVWDVAYTPDSQKLVSGDFDGHIQIWGKDESQHRSVTGHSEGIYRVAVVRVAARGLDLCATAGVDQSITLVDAGSGEIVGSLRGHTGIVHALAFSPDGSRLVSGDTNGVVKIWDIPRFLPSKCLAGHEDWVRSVSFNADDTWLASGSKDSTIRIWSVADGHLVAELPCHGGEVRSLQFSPASNMLAIGTRKGLISVFGHRSDSNDSEWSLLSQIKVYDTTVYSVTFSADGKLLASGGADGRVIIWALDSSGKVVTSRDVTHLEGACRVVAFSPSAALAVAGGKGNIIRVFVPDRNPAAHQPAAPSTLPDWKLDRRLEGHTELVQSLDFSPDGESLASAGYDSTVRIWGVKTGAQQILRGHTGPVWSVNFLPGAQRQLHGGLGDNYICASQPGS